MANRKGQKRQPSAGPKRRRAKMACNYCRGRKIRCDCGLPCKNCVQRGRNCIYTKVTEEENRRARERKNETKQANNSLPDQDSDVPSRRPRRKQNRSTASSSTSQERPSDSEEDARVPPAGIDSEYESSDQTSPEPVNPQQQQYRDSSADDSFYDLHQTAYHEYFGPPSLPYIMQNPLNYNTPQMPSSGSSSDLSSPVSPFFDDSDRGPGSPAFDAGGWPSQSVSQMPSPPLPGGPVPGIPGFESPGPVLTATSPPPMPMPLQVQGNALPSPPSPDTGHRTLSMRMQSLGLMPEPPLYPLQHWSSPMAEAPPHMDPCWVSSLDHSH